MGIVIRDDLINFAISENKVNFLLPHEEMFRMKFAAWFGLGFMIPFLVSLTFVAPHQIDSVILLLIPLSSVTSESVD